MTENHDYYTPSRGATDWDVPLNENFKNLDRDVEVRDVEANRSDYQPDQGTKFLATDTGTVYVGDGTAWTEIGVIPTESDLKVPTIGGTTGRSGLFKHRPLVSTQDVSFSVPGDFDTIQDALSNVPILLKHRYTVQLDPNYGLYDEDIVIPPVWAQDFNKIPNGINTGVFIFGDPNSDGSRSDVGSAICMNPVGYFGVRIDGVRFNRETPYSDDPAGCAFYGGTGLPLLSDCDFDGPTQGVIAYGMRIIVDNLYFESTVDYGLRAKRGGHIFAKRVHGDTTLYAAGGHACKIELRECDTDPSKIHAADGGNIIDNDNGRIYFPNGNVLK